MSYTHANGNDRTIIPELRTDHTMGHNPNLSARELEEGERYMKFVNGRNSLINSTVIKPANAIAEKVALLRRQSSSVTDEIDSAHDQIQQNTSTHKNSEILFGKAGSTPSTCQNLTKMKR